MPMALLVRGLKVGSCVLPRPLASSGGSCPEIDGRLKFITARLAFPNMSNAALAHMLRPCRSYDSLAASCASRQFADGTGFGMGIGIEHVILPVRSLLCGGFVNMS